MIQDGLPANRISAAFHGVASEQINPAAQPLRQFLTNRPQLEETNAYAWSKLNEQVDVTSRMCPASGMRAKEMNSQDGQVQANLADRRPDRFQIGYGSKRIRHV